MKTKTTKKNRFKFFSILMILSILSISFNSCSKDDNNNGNNVSNLDITQNTSWSGVVGVLGGLHIKNGATLKIDAGTKVIFLNQDAYLLVEQGAKIDAQGTSNNMIVFTSTKKEYGSTGGIIINGRAPINEGTGSTSEIGNAKYGGNDINDNSGILKYCRIEFGGRQTSSEKEHNGFTFNGVGSKTVIENIQAYKCSDDAFEWFGGTVNCSNLVAYGSQDDLFDWTSGYTGKLTNLYGEYISEEEGSDRRGIEGDNNQNNENDAPRSNPTLENITLVSNGSTGGNKAKAGLKLRRGTYATFKNLLVKGFDTAFDIEHNSSITHFSKSSSFYKVKILGENILVKSKKSDGTIDNNQTKDIETSINNGTTAIGYNIPSWAITSDDKVEAGKYTSENDILSAGGKIYK